MTIRIILLLLLIGINGILSSSEIAYLSLDKYTLSRKRDKKSRKIYSMLKDESKFLSTIQIGITLAGFMASAFASDAFTDLLMEKGVFFVSEAFTENCLMVVITLILSYITLVFGELFPKKIGRANPERMARFTVHLLSLITNIFYPVILLLTFSTNFLCRLFHIKDRDDSLTEKDIKKMIITGSREGIIEEKEKEYILNIFDFNDKMANKIMTPKEKVISIHIDDTKQDIITKIKKGRFTRFPVIGDNDKVLGFVNVKDFIYYSMVNKELKLKDLIHPTLTFKKNEKIDDIFRIMQEKHENFSIITDKGTFIGILTLEDAIEEIVGNIEDEFNEQKKLIN